MPELCFLKYFKTFRNNPHVKLSDFKIFYFYPSFISSVCITMHIALQKQTLFRVTYFRHFLIVMRGLLLLWSKKIVFKCLESDDRESDGMCVMNGLEQVTCLLHPRLFLGTAPLYSVVTQIQYDKKQRLWEVLERQSKLFSHLNCDLIMRRRQKIPTAFQVTKNNYHCQRWRSYSPVLPDTL